MDWSIFGKLYLDFKVNDYTICDSCSTIELLLHPMAGLFNRCTEKVKVFSHFLAIMAEVDLWCIHA